MSAEVVRLRTKQHDDIVGALQLVLDLRQTLGLPDAAADALSEAQARYAPDTSDGWPFTMFNAESLRHVLKQINACPDRGLTLRVWSAAMTHVRWQRAGLCEIMANRQRLAEDADTNPDEVSRAMGRLVEMGALIQVRRGRYAINPHVGWTGSRSVRKAAAAEQPALALVEPASA